MDSEKLVEGKVYFVCSSAHKKYPIPSIKVLIYVGKKTLYSEIEGFLFQTPEKFFGKEVHELNIEENRTNEVDDKKYSILYPKEFMNLVRDIDGLQEFINDLRNRPNADKIF